MNLFLCSRGLPLDAAAKLLSHRGVKVRVKSLSYSLILALALALVAKAQLATAPPVPEWIEHPAAPPSQTTFFRKSFSAQSSLLKAILLGASDGRMSIALNGQILGEISS